MSSTTTSVSLLRENPNRFVLFPIQNAPVWEMYKKAEASFWTAEELDLGSDRADWKSLTEPERRFLRMTLAFFAASDGIVNENLLMNFANEVQSPEARCFYGFQIAIENIHSEVYSLLIDTYIDDDDVKHRCLNAVENFPCIKRKADWCLRYTERQEPGPEVAAEDLEMFRTRDFCRRLIAFACCEGIFFSSSFASIFFMKKRGKLPGLCFSNELISRDEGLHCDFACLLYSQIRDELGEAPLTPEEIRGIVSDAVECEVAQTKDALNVSLLGLNAAEMEQYVKFCADRLLVALGEEKMYDATQPFEWMNLISLQGKTNFFEKRVGEYSKAGVGVAQEEQVFTLDCDF